MGTLDNVRLAGRVIISDINGNEVFKPSIGGETVMNVADVGKDITAFSGTITSSAGSYSFDCGALQAISFQLTGTFASLSLSFEASLNSTDGINGDWGLVNVAKVDTTTAVNGVAFINNPSTSIYKASVSGYKFFRFRATSLVAGICTIVVKPISGNIEPLPIIPSHPVFVSNAISITVIQSPIPIFINSAAGVTNQNLVASACSLQSFYATNAGNIPAHIKLFNKSTIAVLGTDIPEMIIPVPPAVGGLIGFVDITQSILTHRFNNGLTMVISANFADGDATPVALGQVKVKLQRS